MLKQIEHIAIVVHDLEAALRIYRDAFGFPLLRVEEVPAERVNVAFLQLPHSEGHLELVQPTDADTGIARFLEKRGEGIHHICFRVADIGAAMAHLAAGGMQIIEQEARLGRQGQKYAFVHPKTAHGVLIELYERPTATSAGVG
jgi:methylmalonyl-CoA/ethylmalonyl-CoA epimerase